MNLTCYLIDDESHAIELLAGYVRRTPGLVLAGSSTHSLAALQAITEGPRVALTFLDIDMPELSGLDLAGMIREHTTVIFTTSYREYAPEAFEKDAAGYLLKPISYERFISCIQKIKTKQFSKREHPAYFFVKTDIKGKMVRVNIPDIRYVSSMDNYVCIHLEKEKIIAYLTLQELLEQLPPGLFSRIQKSFVVAHAYIQSLEHFQVRLQDETVLPVGKVYSHDFLEHMKSVLLVSRRKE
jgi:two-component system LytT family response regulator